MASPAPLRSINYAVDKTYIDPIYNPDPGPRQLPNLALRNLYQNNEVHPISVAQFLASQGVISIANWAVQFGETQAEAREKLDPIAGNGPLSHLWSDRVRFPFKRDAEVSSYLTVRLDAKSQRADLASARAAAQRDPNSKPIAVPLDRKQQIRANYVNGASQRFWKLTKARTPHDLF